MNIFYLFYQHVLYDPLFNALVFLYNTVAFHNMGVAIILLTLIIRFALYPLSRQAIQSQRALQKMQPLVNEIREKYKDNKEMQSKEMMKR
jgi:YidC/Oxa1 family membrane protein insertase